MCMKIDVKDDKAFVFTPYNPQFVKEVKRIGGARWMSIDKCWRVPADAVDAVREIMMDVYGESDLPCAEKVTVEIELEEGELEYRGPIVIFGKVIASAFGRDSGAKVGEDVVFVKGEPTSGGSMKNWTTVIPGGSVIRIRNVPVTALNDDYPYDVIDDVKIDRAALEAERERLLKRLAEIEELLKA